ncbi:transposase [Salinispora mooreana]|uniref:transposase n=2 Tax=Salinispora mooreana TaxID=999545 RepID=UPI0003A7C202
MLGEVYRNMSEDHGDRWWAGVVGHVGTRLLAGLADATGLTSVFSEALAGLRQRQGGHDPGRIAVDLAVLRDQPGLFGPVASDPTAWRLLSRLDESLLAGVTGRPCPSPRNRRARHAEVRGDLPHPMVAGRQVEGLILDIDATIVICHSEKESATRTWKKTFGYHPLLCFLDNTGEALAGLLCEGRAGVKHHRRPHHRPR